MGDKMAERTCHNCVYCCHDPCLWLRLVDAGEPLLPRCANHPRWPGQLHDVPGVPCRHYRPRPNPPQGDGVRMIAMINGGYAYVDAADYEWLNRWKWHLVNGCAVRWDKGNQVFMHRQILPPPPGKVTDHGDGNKANNCRSNLRVCSQAENSRNRCKPNGASSAYKGVFYDRERHKWVAKCCCRSKPVWTGYFDTEEEAARAYDRQAVELFGEFARLNFPREWPPERRAQVYAQRQEANVKRKVRRSKGKKEGGCKAKGERKKAKSKNMKPRRAQCVPAALGRKPQMGSPKGAEAHRR